MFRLRLLEEHLGQSSPNLLAPHTGECNQWIRGVAGENWRVGGGGGEGGEVKVGVG